MSQQPQVNMGGPVGGAMPAQQMASMGTPGGARGPPVDPLKRLNTAIYDHLLRNSLYEVARALIKSNAEIETVTKKSPDQNQGQANGVDDSMDQDCEEIRNRPPDLPAPVGLGEGPFLQGWWFQFWEIYNSSRTHTSSKPNTLNYIGAQRNIQKQRLAMMGSSNMDPAAMQNMRGYNNMMQINNGMSDLKRQAMQNQRNITPQQLGHMQKMHQVSNNMQMMSGNQMERQSSQMDMSGPRSGSPNSGDAPSPKRQRLEGNIQQQMGPGGRPGPSAQMPGNQVGPLSSPNPEALAQAKERLRQQGVDVSQLRPHTVQLLAMQRADVVDKTVDSFRQGMAQSQSNTVNSYRQGLAQSHGAELQKLKNDSDNMTKGQMPPNPAMHPGAQASPLSQAGIEPGTGEFYAAHAGRMNAAAAAVAAGQPGGSGGNHALQDYQMQLMLLEQQNKKRLLMARQEQDSMAHPAGVTGPNGQFPVAPGMSPQGSRAGDPSPGSGDMPRGTPKIGKGGMSPNGEMAGRGSPQPGMMPGMVITPEIRQQMMNGQMRPPSSHPMSSGMAPESIAMFQRTQAGMQMPNGVWQPGQPMAPGQMMPGPQPGGPGQPGIPPNMTPRQSNMAPPPPPNQQGNNGTQPSSPTQAPAPPTPSQSSKPKPGAKKAEAKKNVTNKKGGATNATPATEAEAPPTPTPATPVPPMSQNSNHTQNKQLANGQPQPNMPPNQPGAVQPPQPQQSVPPPDMGQPFGSLDQSQFGDINMDFAGLDGGDVLDNFDFDSFLNTGDGNDGLTGFDANFAFGDSTSLEAGGDLSTN